MPPAAVASAAAAALVAEARRWSASASLRCPSSRARSSSESRRSRSVAEGGRAARADTGGGWSWDCGKVVMAAGARGGRAADCRGCASAAAAAGERAFASRCSAASSCSVRMRMCAATARGGGRAAGARAGTAEATYPRVLGASAAMQLLGASGVRAVASGGAALRSALPVEAARPTAAGRLSGVTATSLSLRDGAITAGRDSRRSARPHPPGGGRAGRGRCIPEEPGS
ncbi:hypothetical protein T492DRAFT_964441 [Pavlovales sp. CCMP2436]|nr:hypothetical protein T492DRAFT_964441 [Pavlovales sp. CCMP2436]